MLALFAGEDEIGGRGRIELVDFKGPVEHRNVPPKKIHEHALARLEHGANGEKASRAYSWDAINQSVVDTYLRLQRQRGR